MVQTLGNYNPLFYANQALMILYKALGIANTVHRGYDEERRSFGKGDTITIRRPGSFTAEAAPGSSAQDLGPDTVNITLDQWYEVTFALTDQELAYTQNRIIEEHITPAAYALADNIDTALAAKYDEVPWFVDGSGTNDVMSPDDIVAARQALFAQGAPMRDPRFFAMMSGGSEGELLKVSKFSEMQGAGDQGVATQVSGFIGPKYGFKLFANQNTPSSPQAAVADGVGTVNNGPGYAIGDTSIVVADMTFGAVFSKGTPVKFAGHDQQYVIAAEATMDGAGDGTITITGTTKGSGGTRGLKEAVVNTEVVTIYVDETIPVNNLAYHRNFAALAMAPLSTLGNDRGAEIESLTDPFTGLSLRSRMWYEGKESKVYVSLDILYGVEVLDPDLACRIRTAT